MRTRTLVSIVYSLSCLVSVAQERPNAYNTAYAKWEELAFGNGPAAESIEAFRKLRDAWRTSTQIERDHAAHYFALAAVSTAARAPKDDAGLILGEAAKVAKEYPVVLSRGKSPTRFQEVASVHARVWGESGTDPFAGVSTGYEMTPLGSGFSALQESAEVDPTVALRAGEALEANEELGLLLNLDSSGSVLEELPVAIAGGSSSLRSRLKAIFKHEPGGSEEGQGHFMRQEPEPFFATQSGAETTSTPPSPPVPSHVQPPAPKMPSGQKQVPTTPGEKPPSPMRWPVVAMVVTVLGLLWFLLKKLK